MPRRTHQGRGGIRRGARRGLTFIELLIGLSITATTCGIMAALINATALGTAATNDGRRELSRMESLKSMLADEFGNTRCILATGTNYVVYWTGDGNGVTAPNNAVNMSELRLLEVDNAGNLNVYSVRWTNGMTVAAIQAADTTYAASTDWYATAAALKGTTYYNATLIATGVTSMQVSLDAATPTAAKYIHVRIDISDGTVARQFVSGTSLVNPATPW